MRHKAKILTKQEVESGRSNAYKYLNVTMTTEEKESMSAEWRKTYEGEKYLMSVETVANVAIEITNSVLDKLN